MMSIFMVCGETWGHVPALLLPIKGNSKWLSPLTTPIYFETDNLKELYPNGNRYEGYFMNGKPGGTGTFVWKNG